MEFGGVSKILDSIFGVPKTLGSIFGGQQENSGMVLKIREYPLGINGILAVSFLKGQGIRSASKGELFGLSR